MVNMPKMDKNKITLNGKYYTGGKHYKWVIV